MKLKQKPIILKNFFKKKDIDEINKYLENTRIHNKTEIFSKNYRSFTIFKSNKEFLSKIFSFNNKLKQILIKNDLIIENLHLAEQKIGKKIKIQNFTKVPFVKHRDIHRRFKIFIYLTNCKKKDGPIAFFDKEKKLLTGNKGDVILFDTNFFHCATVPHTNSIRRVLRIDCFKKKYINDQDYLNSMIYKIRNFLSKFIFKSKTNLINKLC